MSQTVLPHPQSGAANLDDPQLANRPHLIYALGFWTAVMATIMGVVYFLTIVAALLTGQMTFPPPDWLQSFGGIMSLLFCPILIIVMIQPGVLEYKHTSCQLVFNVARVRR